MAYISEYTDLHPKERRQLEYKRLFKTENPDWDDSMILLRDQVSRLNLKNATVLDYGCGRGNFVIDELKGSFSNAIGLDVDKEATTGNISVNQVVISNDELLPFPDKTFDLVLSLWVFEHVKAPDVTLREITRVLKPGGTFAFVTPNRNSFLILARRMMTQAVANTLLRILYAREADDVFPVYYRTNARRKIVRLARRAGLEVTFLRANPDPSYTSFNRGTYKLSALLAKIPLGLFRPHLICLLKKTS